MGPQHHPTLASPADRDLDPDSAEALMGPPVPVAAASSPVEQLGLLPRFYDWKDLLACFDGDQDALTAAYCDGLLTPAQRQVLEDSLPVYRLQAWLLRRISRQLDCQLLAPPSLTGGRS